MRAPLRNNLVMASSKRFHSGGQSREYAALVCASGTLWDPIIPELPGAEAFGGAIRHSVTSRSADEVQSRRVLVVGGGNSGADIACDVARTAASVSLSMRRGYWFVPKFIAGRPSDKFFRRRDGLPEWAHPPDAAALLKLLVGPHEAYGLETPDHPPFAAHPIMNTEVLHHMGHGRVCAGIAHGTTTTQKKHGIPAERMHSFFGASCRRASRRCFAEAFT